MTSAIETTGLSKSFGRVNALKPISLNVRLGCCFGLLGPNGAGKSTLVKTLLGIVRASEGSARLLGKDFRDPESRRKVGYLPEGHRFPRYLTGRGVCRYFGQLSGLHGPSLEAEISKKLEIVGMQEWGDVKVTKYSKGMMQRVGLAQALLGDPQLVFLDEPTDGVDPVGRQQLREVIRSYANGGRTIFLNSHLLSEVELVCDEIAILHKGELLQQGAVSTIKQNVDSQSKGFMVRVQTDPIPDQFFGKWASRGAQREPDNWFSMPLTARTEITALIDELRATKIGIYAVEPKHANLEDAFIHLITAEGDTSVGGDHS